MEHTFIPLSVPNLKGNELQYVTTAMESGWVSTGGSYVGIFESKIAEYVHSKGAVSCQNGTAGLHIALLLAGVTREDVVLVPSLTFIAAVNPVKYIGARPVFMDCDESLCMDPVKLKRFCEEECIFEDGKLMERESGRQIKAVVVVHVFGNMADMQAFKEIGDTYGLIIIEDATEALGTYYTEGHYKGKYAGTIGDIGVYSFNGNKIITTGGGGMLVSDHEDLLKRARHLTTQAKSDELYYEHDEVGFNYRMTNIQAGMGIAQLEQLEQFIETKIENYQIYQRRLKEIEGLDLLSFREGVRSNHWFYGILCDGFRLGRDALIHYLSDNQIQTRPIWGLIHRQVPYLQDRAYSIKNAPYYWERVVNVPCSTNLKAEQVEHVIDTIQKA